MNLAQALTSYINLNLLIAIGFLGLSSLSWTLRQLNRQLKSKTELDLQYVALAFLLTLTVVQPFVPTKKFFEPTLKIWAAQSMEDFPKDYSVLHGRGYLSLPSLAGPSSLDADRVAGAWMILLSAMLTLGSFVMIRDLRKLYILRQRSFLIRRIRNVRIYANDEILVPFSYWLPTQASVVIPAQFIGHREFYKIAVAHELQHHRQGDTSWVYILWGLRLFCVANPFIHLWSRWISEIQEFACDETLVDQNKVDSKAYARCLIEVAQTAICQKYVPVCATGLTFLIERNILKRRIQKMIRKNVAKPWKPVGTAFGLALASLMAVTAFATKNVVQDRRVSMEQALAMAKNVQGKTAFPVVVNKLVLKQLNRYIGTPEGRDFMRSSLQRMENYRKVVEQKITDYGVPEELMAIPIVESGYQNLIESKKIGWGGRPLDVHRANSTRLRAEGERTS